MRLARDRVGVESRTTGTARDRTGSFRTAHISDRGWATGTHRLCGPRTTASLRLAALILWPLPAATRILYPIARGDNVLRVIDPETGATITDSIFINPPFVSVTGASGLSQHPSKASL